MSAQACAGDSGELPSSMPELHSLPPEEVFTVLDLERPELAEVKAALAERGREAALAALLAHYRRRFPLPETPPELDEETRRLADNLTRRVFEYHFGYGPTQYGDDMEWEWNPHGDIEWVAWIYRFMWAAHLADAFAATRDETYARTFVDLARDWIAKHPLEKHARAHPTLTNWKGFAWLDLQTGLRATYFRSVFPTLVHAKAFTPEFLGVFLASLFDHQVKSELIPRSSHHNKGLMELRGLMGVAAAFPEFRDARRWIEIGMERSIDQLFGQTTADGVQREWCMGYHSGVAWHALENLRFAEAAGVAVPPAYRERVHALFETCFQVCAPGMAFPMFGDTSRDSKFLRRFLAEAAEVFDEPKYAALAEGDLDALPPARSFARTESGLYVMRDSWTRDGVYFALHDPPPPLSGHDQPDNGTFELYAFGRWLMPDSGYFTYGHDREGRAWHRRTRVHNTLTLDGGDCAVRGVHRLWVTDADLDALCSENAAYEGLVHRRAVWFVDRRFFVLLDDVLGDAQGDLDLHFWFAPGEIELDADARRVRTLADDANVLMAIESGTPLRMEKADGWTSHGYNQREPRFGCRVRLETRTPPARVVTLLVPYRGADPPEADARLIAGDPESSRAEIKVALDGETWRLALDVDAGAMGCEAL